MYENGVAYRTNWGDLSSRVSKPKGPTHGSIVKSFARRGDWIRVKHNNSRSYWLPLRIDGIGTVFVDKSTPTKKRAAPRVTTKKCDVKLNNLDDMKGWLLKNRPDDPEGLWKRRYFVCRKGYLMWDTNECVEPTKRQFLSGYSVRPMTGSSARPHTMCVWHPQNRVINLQAKNSDSLRVWMSAVGKHISIANSLQNSRPEWEENTSSCTLCDKSFGLFTRPHHCRNCGRCVCST